MRKVHRANSKLIVAIVAALLGLIICEGVIRIIGRTDTNGQFYFGGIPLKPYRLPVVSTSEILNSYFNSSTSYVIDDPYLGWTIRPNSISENGLYRANSDGLRGEAEYNLDPRPGVLRIAIYGDSFTHGDEVVFEDTWGYQLELLLDEMGMDTEVINFGVGGYGMDQAYLRWQHFGRQYGPDIVLFGFQAENVNRNMNIFRPFFIRDNAIPFLKPRFLLKGEQLVLVNSPAPPPEEVLELVANFGESSLAGYEYFFDADDYVEPVWLKSKLFALIFTHLEPRLSRVLSGSQERMSIYDADSEAGRLALEILQAFREDVEASGARFIAVHLPLPSTLWLLQDNQPIDYQELLNELDSNFPVIHTESHFLDGVTPIPDYFVGHYSALGNRVVASAIADYLYQNMST
jgi:hypothetical protein